MTSYSKNPKAERNRLARERAAIAASKQPTTERPIKRIPREERTQQAAQPIIIARPSVNVAPARRTSEEQPDLFNAVRASFNRTLQQVTSSRARLLA